MKEERAWIGVDFDGTLATTVTKEWDGPLGEPIAPMVARVKRWLVEGRVVKILTARASRYDDNGWKLDEAKLKCVINRIQTWCSVHLGQILEVTESKDHNMIELWDDKAIGVARDIGEIRTDISRQIPSFDVREPYYLGPPYTNDPNTIHPTPGPIRIGSGPYVQKLATADLATANQMLQIVDAIRALQRRVRKLEKGIL
jgi:hypothetical protein